MSSTPEEAAQVAARSAAATSCEEEKTPRQAAGCERHGARLEAVLKVAPDLLALH